MGDIADLLVRHGANASEPTLDHYEQFVRACLRLDADAARRLLEAHPEFRQAPDAMFVAARRNRADVIALLLQLGVPLEVQDATGKRALHEAAAHNSAAAAELLIARGAAIDPRESMYGAPPIGWAAHGDHRDVLDLLSRHSRHVWTLCFRGYLDRLQQLLLEDPGLARGTDREGQTLLWWLPEDEEQALAAADLLLKAGVDPRATSTRGQTAAHCARRLGMRRVAARLEP
jgi:ankyrin repeat protein